MCRHEEVSVDPTLADAAILFEPDGYVLSGPKLMGRQAAGNGFLRAAVAGRGNAPLFAYTPHRRSAEVFGQLVKEMDAKAVAQWIPADRLDIIASVGALFLPGPGIDAAGRLRLRVGGGAYSLVGMTHTLASHGAMDSLVGLLSAPVMPWDALICTSSAGAGAVKNLLEAEIEYLRWRFGPALQLTLPQLPIIPLGVHCDDFAFSAEEREMARQAQGIAEDEVVVLFFGRLSFHAKAHPHAMYLGLQAATERTGKKVTLLQCGRFANEAIKQSFTEGGAFFCPSVRSLFVDGRGGDIPRQCWAAADIFISLSDNIQETFGLTPIEAMAAGLPVVVSDWDGYKDTVRDGVDGFRIQSWMPPPNLGEGLARSHEAGIDNYDLYCGLTCQTVALDGQVLADRLAALIAKPELRLEMGRSGQARARQVFDWAGVYRQYQTLYAQLADIRRDALQDPTWQGRLAVAPKAAASRMDPFRCFGHYPTAQITSATLVSAAAAFNRVAYESLVGHSLFSYASKILPASEVVERLLVALGKGALSVQALAEQTGIDLGTTVLAVAVLGKMGLMRPLPSRTESSGQV